jgi:hypothetical protein
LALLLLHSLSTTAQLVALKLSLTFVWSCDLVWGLGFGVWGLGFGVWG